MRFLRKNTLGDRIGEEAMAERERQAQEAANETGEAAKNGTSGMTQEEADYLWSLLQ